MSTFAATMDPDDTLDFSMDWTSFLAGLTGSPTINTVSVTSDRLTITNEGESGGIVKWRASGDSLTGSATITVRVTLSDAQQTDRSIAVKLQHL